MDAAGAGPSLVSLGELRLLGGFLRYREIASRLPAAREGGEAPRAYPLFKSWLPPDTHVDLFTGDRWQRVKLVGVQDDQITYLERSGRKSQHFDRWYDIAPAGHFSDDHRSPAAATRATLRDSFQPVRRGHVIKDPVVKNVSGPYVTFGYRSFDPDARWVDEADMWHGSCTLHVADPRVNVEGVTPREPLFNTSIAVSHRWLSPKQPDPDGRQFSEFVQLCQTLCLHEAQTFLIDHCALPQRPRTRAEAALFRRLLPQFQAQFKRQVLVLNEGSEDYRTRGWCMLELMLAALNSSLLHREGLSSGLVEAYQLAEGYVKNQRMHEQNLARYFGGAASRASFDHFLRDPIAVALYNARLTGRNAIVDLFENKLAVTDRRDIPLIVGLVRNLALGEGADEDA